MRTIPMPEHPDVTYWSCPEAGGVVAIRGDQFTALAYIGQLVETDDLVDILPGSVMEEAESLVEKHEARHLSGDSA